MQKSFIKSFVLAAATALTVLLSPSAFGQGVVSSGITGTIQDDTGKPVAGAAVTVVHVPTNSVASAVTGTNGRFRVSGLRVGGPYTVTAEADGYTIRGQNEVNLGLGADTDVTLLARSDVLVLEKFVTSGAATDLDAAATGAGSVLNNRGLSNMPTSTRSFADMMKTNPFVTVRAFPQVTALGMNNRYNSITLDGARINDQFGLAGSGLFSLRNPFSLDAVENFSISLTPYDVTQSGFAGGSVNVVSKSGTNEFHGSAYYLYTSHKWQGEDVSGTNVGKRPTPFYERTWGATLGGPIIKNKLFFFVNYEKFSNPSGGPTEPGFTPTSAVLSALDAQFSALPGSPDFGTFGAAGSALEEDEKKLIKLDWNINDDHRLSVRYSRTEGNRPQFPEFRGFGAPSSMPTITPAPSYVNGVTTTDSKFYTLAINEEVWAGQLFSNWSPDLRTEFAFSKNDSTSLRSTPVNLPEVVILGVPGTSDTGTSVSTNNALLYGTDYSSMGNGVISNGISFSGNGSYTWRDFTFKAGFDHEETDFENLFRNGSYGRFVYNYSPTLHLATDTPLAFARNVATEGFPGTDISKLEQTGYFAQAKWEPNQRLNVTFGLRYDVLGSPIAPTFNPAIVTAFGVRNDGTIDGTSRVAPRISFNYAVDQDRKIQVRGGLGVFLGRNPWVWISNSYGNAGFGRFTVSRTGSSARPNLTQYLAGSFTDADPVFKFDPEAPRGTSNLTTGGGDIAFIRDGLKLPTNLRGNLAADFKLPTLDAIVTVEYIHTNVMEALFYRNINLVPAGTGADGRTYFRRIQTSTGNVIPLGTASPSGTTVNTRSLSFSRAFELSNVDAGSSDYVAVGIDRPFKNGWAYNVTYTRGRALEAQPAGSSTASSQWAFNVVFNQAEIEEVRSDYEIRDRLQASISKEFRFFERFKTTATLYYEGRSGQPYSYVYSGDLNFDGNSANDAVAVPTGASDPRFNFGSMSSAQQNAYFAFLDSSGLSKFAGGYAPRNSFIGPWQNRLDLHLSQEVKVAGPFAMEVFADFINFGSWLNKDLFNYVETLGANTSNSNQNRVLGNATYGADGRIIPTVTLGSDGNVSLPAASSFLPNNTDARWRIVAGVRLRF